MFFLCSTEESHTGLKQNGCELFVSSFFNILWFHPFGITFFFLTKVLTKVGVVSKAYMFWPCNRRFICDIHLIWGVWQFPSALFLCFSPLCLLPSLLTLFHNHSDDRIWTHTHTEPWLQFKCNWHTLPVFGFRWWGMDSLLSMWLHIDITLLQTVPLQEALRLPVTCSINLLWQEI